MPEFDYIRVPCAKSSFAPNGYLWQPIIPIKLKYGSRTIPVMAFVDTGASYTTMPYEVAEISGINPESGTVLPVLGIDGLVQTYLHDGFIIRIGSHEIRTPIAFKRDVQPLLGRYAVFDSFEVSFNERKLSVRFHPFDR